MLDDIDYGALSAQEPTEQPKKKAGVSERSVVRKIEKKQLDVAALENKSQQLEQSIPAPEIPDPLAQYGLPVLGVLGGLAAAYTAWKQGEKKASYPTASVPADNKGSSAVQSVEQNVEQAAVSQADRLQQLKERVLAGRQAGIGAPPPQPSAGPTYNVPTANAPQIGVQVPAQVAAPVQPPVAPTPVEQATPSVAQAVEAGVSPSKAIQTDVAQQLDKANGITGRVRRTKAQIEQAAAEALANAPEGKIPAAPKKTNKIPGDVIGQGGWHWYEGQMGPEAEQAWLREFGRTNQPYQRVVEAVKEGRLPVPAPTDGKKGGAFPRQEYVPEYIKGNISLAQLGSLAANALGAAGLLQAYKEGKQTGDYSNLGLGAIDQILGNVAPRAGLATSLMAPAALNVGESQELERRRKKPATIDRAIAPR